MSDSNAPKAPKPYTLEDIRRELAQDDVKRDTARAVKYLHEIGKECLNRAAAYNDRQTVLLDKVTVIAACMELPGDLPLRVFLMPDVLTHTC